jgi:hypothetical protein
MMTREILVAAVALWSIGCGATARAQATDPLGICLATHANAQDRAALVRWVFAAMARSAAVRDMVEVSEAKRAEATRGAAAIVERLLTRDCRAEAVMKLRTSPNTMQRSFTELGARATQDLLRDPAVIASFAGILQHVDMAAFGALVLESRARRAR